MSHTRKRGSLCSQRMSLHSVCLSHSRGRWQWWQCAVPPFSSRMRCSVLSRWFFRIRRGLSKAEGVFGCQASSPLWPCPALQEGKKKAEEQGNPYSHWPCLICHHDPRVERIPTPHVSAHSFQKGANPVTTDGPQRRPGKYKAGATRELPPEAAPYESVACPRRSELCGHS